MDIYKSCPSFSNDKYILRRTEHADLADLLKVYGDKNAVPFFNSDNCHGDDFYYTTEQRMREALDFWQQAYENGWFVRWSIVDKATGAAVGTIEEFRREANDRFTDCGLLRLDLRSDYEKAEEIRSILSLIAEPSLQLFGCSIVATKAIPAATERIAALKALGFVPSSDKLVGFDGTQYSDYFVLSR